MKQIDRPEKMHRHLLQPADTLTVNFVIADLSLASQIEFGAADGQICHSQTISSAIFHIQARHRLSLPQAPSGQEQDKSQFD